MLVTIDEFKASTFYDEKWGDQAIEEALRYGEHRFYTLTNRHNIGYWFLAQKETHEIHGTGHEYIRVPHPVLGIEAVSILSPAGTQQDVTSSVRFSGHYLWRAGKWPTGFCNIIATVWCGDPKYAHMPDPDDSGDIGGEVPSDVKEAVLRLAELKLRRAKPGTERVLDRRPPVPGGEAVPPPTITGDREVDAIVRSYYCDDMSGSWDFR